MHLNILSALSELLAPKGTSAVSLRCALDTETPLVLDNAPRPLSTRTPLVDNSVPEFSIRFNKKAPLIKIGAFF